MQTLTTPDLPQIRDLRARDEFFWLDLFDPDHGTLEALGDVLHLHKLAVEDTQEFGQRPKIDVYGDEILLVYYGASEDADGLPAPVEVHLHISGSFVVTVHREHCQRLEVAHETLDRRPADNEQVLVYRILDALTDSILEVLENVAVRVDEHENQVFHRPRARDRDRMALLRRSLGNFRRTLVIQRQTFERAVERISALPGLERDFSSYYRDVGDHLWRAIDEVEAARDTLQGILETYTNEVQERLTIVATIFLPLTVVTGFFGQNFGWMVNHIGSGWTFWGLGVGGLVFSILAIVFWLYRTGLYHGPKDDR